MTPNPPGLCVFCRVGERRAGVTSITLTRDETAIVIRQVPADLCDNCGHAYFDSAVVEVLEQIHEATLAAGAKYAVRDFSAKVA